MLIGGLIIYSCVRHYVTCCLLTVLEQFLVSGHEAWGLWIEFGGPQLPSTHGL